MYVILSENIFSLFSNPTLMITLMITLATLSGQVPMPSVSDLPNNFFHNLTFLLSRETPIASLEYVILCAGGKVTLMTLMTLITLVISLMSSSVPTRHINPHHIPNDPNDPNDRVVQVVVQRVGQVLSEAEQKDITHHIVDRPAVPASTHQREVCI